MLSFGSIGRIDACVAVALSCRIPVGVKLVGDEYVALVSHPWHPATYCIRHQEMRRKYEIVCVLAQLSPLMVLKILSNNTLLAASTVCLL